MTIASVSSDKLTLTLTSNLKYSHISFIQTSNVIAAGVGLLTRNVKVIGAEYPQQAADLYGFSILVTDYSSYDSNGILLYYKGYARLTNVEFVHPGQFFRGTSYDATYGIIISNLGAYDYVRTTYVRSCSFHQGYSVGIGILGSSSIPIESNVFYGSLDSAVYLEGDSNIVRYNLITMTYWATWFVPYDAQYDFNYFGGVTAHMADSAVIEHNFIAGAQRSGIFYKGDVCAGQSIGSNMNHSIKYNTLHSCLIGLNVFPDTSFNQLTCISLSKTIVYKSAFYGVYYQNPWTVEIDSMLLVDNQVGVVAFALGPSSLSHRTSTKNVKITNSVFVGRSSSFNCTTDVMPYDFNFNQSHGMQTPSAGADGNGFVGIVFSSFLSGGNGCPRKPCLGVKSYMAISGLTKVTNVTFINYNNKSVSTCGTRDYTIVTNGNK